MFENKSFHHGKNFFWKQITESLTGISNGTMSKQDVIGKLNVAIICLDRDSKCGLDSYIFVEQILRIIEKTNDDEVIKNSLKQILYYE